MSLSGLDYSFAQNEMVFSIGKVDETKKDLSSFVFVDVSIDTCIREIINNFIYSLIHTGIRKPDKLYLTHYDLPVLFYSKDEGGYLTIDLYDDGLFNITSSSESEILFMTGSVKLNEAIDFLIHNINNS